MVSANRPPPSPDAEAVRRLDEGLVRALHALLTEANVSRAAARLGIAQPAMSRHLRSLRELTGDELLVRIGNRMVPTPRAESLLAPARRILNDMALIATGAGEFSPATAQQTFRLASYDFLPPSFFAGLVARVTRASPGSELVLRGIGERQVYIRQLGEGEIDVALTSRQDLPGHLRAASLFKDPVVCVLRQGHPLERQLTLDAYRAAGHVSALEQAPGTGGAMDALLQRIGVSPNTVLRTQYFGLIGPILLQTDLVLTTGTQLARAMAHQYPLAIVPFPGPIGPLRYSIVWHERSHKNPAQAWLRSEIQAAARELLATSHP